jgi:hypothetical protein
MTPKAGKLHCRAGVPNRCFSDGPLATAVAYATDRNIDCCPLSNLNRLFGGAACNAVRNHDHLPSGCDCVGTGWETNREARISRDADRDAFAIGGNEPERRSKTLVVALLGVHDTLDVSVRCCSTGASATCDSAN